MTGVEVIGWAAAVVGTGLGVPQLARLARTRSTAGLSLVAWQAILTLNLCWFAHGVKINQPNMIVPNVLGLATTLPVLYLMSRDLRLNPLRVMLPGALGAAVLVLIDVGIRGPTFGVFSLVPAVVANLGQSIEVIRAEAVTGLSPVFLVLGLVNQILWLSWAIGIQEVSSTISSGTIAAIVTFTLVWYSLRRLGLRPMFARDAAAVPLPDHRVEDMDAVALGLSRQES